MDHLRLNAKRFLRYFFIINNCFIFAGFAFDIDMFSTYDPHGEYDEDWRFGYKGLIWGQNAVAAIYALGIAYFFRENFRYQRPKLVPLFSTCLASILVGTKASWLALILISSYYLYRYRVRTLVILVLPIFIILIHTFIKHWSYIEEKYLSFMVSKFYENDLTSFITSGRSSYLLNTINYMEDHWALLNFFTGDAISYVEMDFFDLYFYFGAASIIHLYIYSQIFFIKDTSIDNKYFFLVWMGIAFVAGHVINSAVVPVFLLLFVFSASNQNVKHIRKHNISI